MESTVKHQEYQLVDLLKLFFCLCVVAIHSHILPDYAWVSAIVRLAVPFFFVASGFFLGKKVLVAEKTEIWSVIKRYCLRLLKPFLAFSAIVLLEHFVFRLIDGEAFVGVLKDEIHYLLVYPSGALWYIAACMVGSLLLFPFLRAKKLNIALIIGIVLYGFLLCCNNYFFVVENTRLEYVVWAYLNIFISARNGVFAGFLLLGIGIKCAELFCGKEEKFTKKRVFPILMIAILIYAVEVAFVWKFAAGFYREDGGYYISQLFLVPLLLFGALILPLNLSEKLARTFRGLSVGIYLLHSPILAILKRFELQSAVNFVITLAVAFTICLVVYRFKKEPLYSLLR